MKTVNHIRRGKRGSALVEYGLIVAGVALVGALAVGVFGEKLADLLSLNARILPGLTEGENSPLKGGGLFDTKEENGRTVLDINSGSNNIEDNFGVDPQSVTVD